LRALGTEAIESLAGGVSDKVFGILVGGGPAPGINGVIGAAATTALESGAKVVGIYDGFKHLMSGKTDLSAHVRWLSREDVARIHLEGGSILRTARANPTKQPEHLANTVAALKGLGVNHLVTIGGDDTATSSIKVAEAADGLRVVHVPKTIDNDLPLPGGIPTFGYETAREHGAAVIERIIEDCKTTGRWFVIVVMGRTAGHLALGSATAAGAHVVVVPEELPGGDAAVVPLDEIVRRIEGALVKRRAAGHPDGVAVVAEGIAEHIDPADLTALESVARDEHGHIRLADVPLGRVLCDALKASLAARGVDVAFYTKDVGYELRCAAPTAFDREYTRDLGVGAVRSLMDGVSGALITRQAGACVPIPFADLLDPKTGRAGVRRIDTSTDSYRHAVSLQSRVVAADLEADRLAAIAEAAGLSPDDARKRYAVS
jgi:6-phosphofructokinase